MLPAVLFNAELATSWRLLAILAVDHADQYTLHSGEAVSERVLPVRVSVASHVQPVGWPSAHETSGSMLNTRRKSATS